MSTETVFLVNPASANGSTGRRWAEMAYRAATRGLEGDVHFSERPGPLGELARAAAEHFGPETRDIVFNTCLSTDPELQRLHAYGNRHLYANSKRPLNSGEIKKLNLNPKIRPLPNIVR